MFKRHFVLMSALGVALSAGAAAVASAFDATEKFVVTGALKVTHVITDQVCDFSTLDELETYLANVADRHNWFRHDQHTTAEATTAGSDDTAGQLAAPMGLAQIVGDTTALEQIDTTAAQVETLAAAPIVFDPAPQLAENAALEAQATALLNADGSPQRNPFYAGQFEGETVEQAEARRAAAAAENVAQRPDSTDTSADTSAPAVEGTVSATQPAQDTAPADTAAPDANTGV